MQKILIAIDFSPPSLHAFRYGVEMAAKYESKVVLLHVHSPEMIEPFAPVFFQNALLNHQKDAALSHFSNLQQEISPETLKKISLEYMILTGPVAEEILVASEEVQPDMIIMGMRGGNYLLQRIMGSVTNSVIQRALFPVLVIPEKAEISEIKEIAYATNFERDDIQAIGIVLKFAKKIHARVRCIHIHQLGDEGNDYKQQILQKAYQHELTMDEVQFENLSYKNVVEGLNHFAGRKKVDLLVMLTHHRGVFSQIFHSSHTQKMALQSNIPLWVFQMGNIPKAKKTYPAGLKPSMA